MNNTLEKIIKKKSQWLDEIKKNVSIDFLKDKIAKNKSYLNFKEKISDKRLLARRSLEKRSL